jgi:hypothetical protein
VPKKQLAEYLRDEMILQGRKKAWAGDPDLCLEAYEKFGGKVEHPLNRIKATLDAARRSDLFIHMGYIQACDCTGRREIGHPYFVLSQATEQTAG